MKVDEMNMKEIKRIRREKLYSALTILFGIATIILMPYDCGGSVFVVILGIGMWLSAEADRRKLKKAVKSK